jgi:hypothetical protein
MVESILAEPYDGDKGDSIGRWYSSKARDTYKVQMC